MMLPFSSVMFSRATLKPIDSVGSRLRACAVSASCFCVEAAEAFVAEESAVLSAANLSKMSLKLNWLPFCVTRVYRPFR